MRDRRSSVSPNVLLFALAAILACRAEAGVRLIAPLDEPTAVAAGADGSIYVCEAGSHRVSVFDSQGALVRRWGRFGTGSGELDGPRGVAVAEDGRVYVADTGNDRIQVFAPDGSREREWGRHGSDAGELDEPQGLAVRDDRVYVADTGNDRIQVFRRDGTFLFYVWSYGYHDGAFDRPVGIAVDAAGSFYVSDLGNSRLQKFSPDGKFELAWGGRGHRGGLLIEPGGLDEREGRITVADPKSGRLVAYDGDGTFLGEWRAGSDAPSSVLSLPSRDALVVCSAIEDGCRIVSRSDLEPVEPADPRKLAREGYSVGGAGDLMIIASRQTGIPYLVDVAQQPSRLVTSLSGPGREPLETMRPGGFELDVDRETVLVSDGGNARLSRLELGRGQADASRFDPTRLRFVKGIGLDDHERLNIEPGAWILDPPNVEPGAIVRDARRRLLVADTLGRRIVALNDDDRLAGWWGGFGDGDGRFRRLAGIAIDRARTLVYALDGGRRRVQAFDLDGRLRFAWGRPGHGPGEFVSPSGIAAGRDGSVYVVDRGASRVQRFDGRGVPLASWGGPGSADGQFFRPEAIYVDGHGRVVVIDSGNGRAQAFTPAGRLLWEMPLDPSKLAAAAPRAERKPRRVDAPRRAPMDCANAVVSNAGRYTVCATIEPHPVPFGEPFAMNVSVYEGAKPGRLAQNVVLDVDAAMPEHRHGMGGKPIVRAVNGPPVQDLLPGHGAMANGLFEVRGMLFHMPGRWEIHFDLTHGAITERAQLEIVLD